MAYTAEITHTNIINIGEGNYLVTLALTVKDDGIDIFNTSVEALINKDTADKETVLKQKLESKLMQAWDQYLAANAVTQSQQAFDDLCATIIGDVENYLNQ